ncbi:MAG: cupin [Bdellovibrionales bacterium CG10_big_fil_rev_8_21_14_0_10_45_34]|nr:MAG: cupin [Bdellovibrionales bacterium CG10_big_fil_rev_8_21_14_0_10_45_34]
MSRPECIKHYKEIQEEDTSCYKGSGSDELLSIGSPFGKVFGLNKLGIHHELLPPGRRTSWPHAESDEEEFVYVIEGAPDAWINGRLYRLKSGDGVGFPCGTGIAHTIINNTNDDVRLLVVGEATKKENKCFYPLHPQRNEEIRKKDFLWENSPKQEMGDHDGLPDQLRDRK